MTHSHWYRRNLTAEHVGEIFSSDPCALAIPAAYPLSSRPWPPHLLAGDCQPGSPPAQRAVPTWPPDGCGRLPLRQVDAAATVRAGHVRAVSHGDSGVPLRPADARLVSRGLRSDVDVCPADSGQPAADGDQRRRRNPALTVSVGTARRSTTRDPPSATPSSPVHPRSTGSRTGRPAPYPTSAHHPAAGSATPAPTSSGRSRPMHAAARSSGLS